MADEQIQQPAENNQPDQAAIKAELDQQMAASGIIPQPAASANGDGGAQQEQQNQAQSPEAPVDIFAPFKTEFGYDSPEVAMQEIRDLRAFKASPKYPELEVEHPESAAMMRAIASGKKDEVYKWLHQDMQIDRLTNLEVTKDTAAEIVKMGMQLKYKDQQLTPEEINYKFNKQFGIPPKPVQNAGMEDDADYQQRVSDWQAVVDDKNMELMIEAKLAKPEIQNAKSKLTFPIIEQEADPEYSQWKKSLEDNQKVQAQTAEAYKAFTPKNIETKINFKDEANKIDFDFQYEPDADSFKKTQEIVSDFDKFYQLFYKPDGTPDRREFLEAIHFALNRKNIILSAINQGKNAAIKASLPDNSTGGMVRQIAQPQPEVNELDQQMRRALRGHGGF